VDLKIKGIYPATKLPVMCRPELVRLVKNLQKAG